VTENGTVKIHDFNGRLKDSILNADGAMGSDAARSRRFRNAASTNSKPPSRKAVFRVHQAYIEAGAHIIERIRLARNRFKLAPCGLADEVQRLNSRGVENRARKRANPPLAKCLLPAPSAVDLACSHATRSLKKFRHFSRAGAGARRARVDFYIWTFSYIEELAHCH